MEEGYYENVKCYHCYEQSSNFTSLSFNFLWKKKTLSKLDLTDFIWSIFIYLFIHVPVMHCASQFHSFHQQILSVLPSKYIANPTTALFTVTILPQVTTFSFLHCCNNILRWSPCFSPSPHCNLISIKYVSLLKLRTDHITPLVKCSKQFLYHSKSKLKPFLWPVCAYLVWAHYFTLVTQLFHPPLLSSSTIVLLTFAPTSKKYPHCKAFKHIILLGQNEKSALFPHFLQVSP